VGYQDICCLYTCISFYASRTKIQRAGHLEGSHFHFLSIISPCFSSTWRTNPKKLSHGFLLHKGIPLKRRTNNPLQRLCSFHLLCIKAGKQGRRRRALLETSGKDAWRPSVVASCSTSAAAVISRICL
jgi:hypothetical protein